MTLHDIELQENLFETFDLDLDILQSKVKELKIHIPWKSIKKDVNFNKLFTYIFLRFINI